MEEKLPVVRTERRKVVQVGGSNMICLPMEWCKEHNVEPGQDITIVFADDLRILAPESVPHVSLITEEIIADGKGRDAGRSL